MSDQDRRAMALFPIGIVMKLTELTARQIRYYEQNGLIQPARTEGRQRLFSFNDVDRLLEIKELLDKGLNIAGIKQVLKMPPAAEKQAMSAPKEKAAKKELSDKELRQLLKQQLFNPSLTHEPVLNRGELSRFFH
ncbi:MerR family transcriptional regulator [Brevibacillus massiliensis]|jgi:MerR family glutamine synthetase transcriptional repressor|uniref:MerR family transcriptional regulator n=1 Tax=Brevibacillus massiliensis TaxID=1118054 RepID=UPI0002E59008|nr:MerR family transcriptional regulator [Brevibacillus massiliensis]